MAATYEDPKPAPPLPKPARLGRLYDWLAMALLVLSFATFLLGWLPPDRSALAAAGIPRQQVSITYTGPARVAEGTTGQFTFTPRIGLGSPIRVQVDGIDALTSAADNGVTFNVPAVRSHWLVRRVVPVVLGVGENIRAQFGPGLTVKSQLDIYHVPLGLALLGLLLGLIGLLNRLRGALLKEGLFETASSTSRELALRDEIERLRAVTRAEREAPFDEEDGPLPGASADADLPLPTPPSALVEACGRGATFLVTGAGLGIEAGLPSWRATLRTLIRQERYGSADDQSLRRMLKRNELDAVTELLERRLGSDRLLDVFVELAPTDARWEPFARLARSVPFCAFATTSFDTLIEQSMPDLAVFTPRSRQDFSALLRDGQPFLLKLHGDLGQRETVILTSTQFKAMLEEVPDMRALLAGLVSSRTVLFMGMDSQAIEALLDPIMPSYAGAQRHFALVPHDPDLAVTAERFAARFNIELLPVSGEQALMHFIDELIEQVETQRNTITPQDHPIVPAAITRVELRNIGPFTEAALDFSKPWTVLLGNNAAGKSTLLRAIVLALSGTDTEARDAARSLLKRGETSGSIEITVATPPTPTVYRSQLTLDAQDRLIIKAAVAPLQAGTLPVFGFPALRGVAQRGKIDITGANQLLYPRVADVLPLLCGGVDQRGTELRRWILTSDLRSRDPALPPEKQARYAAMIRSFFILLDTIIPGFDIQFARCDSETYEIFLKTTDGEVPLDYISQGMSSTIGWAGTLIQRLYEIAGESSNPEDQQAILLIDEIDSHLHPEWQQTLVPSIKTHFPKLQVIATTHSPLVVGALEEGEVVRVRRTSGGLTIEPLQQSYQGYRADQILTDSAFDLASARALEWERKAEEYTMLLGKSCRTPEEAARFQALDTELEAGPPPFETRGDRERTTAILTALAEAVVPDAIAPEAVESKPGRASGRQES